MTKDPVDYRMTVHLFGGTWSPSCCNFVLRHTARENQDSFSTTSVQCISRDFYVDDLLMSVPCEDDAIAVMTDLKKLLLQGGFKLTKWISNSRHVIAEIPEDDRAKDVKGLDLNQQALPVERALGVSWDVDKDAFMFKINRLDKPLTRRGLLSAVSSIYDPIGFLAPFTITAKKYIQDLTRLKIGWDEPLPIDVLNKWTDWVSSLPKISEMIIPRCYKATGEVSYYQLHHFSDASQMAYGVVSYLRIEFADGRVRCCLVLSKSRLAPVKSMTIPRLELEAAALAVQVNAMLQRELDLKISKTTYWTDSTVVLGYIQNVNRRFQTYVANRISVIHTGSTVRQWKHIESCLNPADDVSRGLSAADMVECQRWMSGPPFLYEPECDWPSKSDVPIVSDSDPEVKRDKSVRSYLADTQNVTDISPLEKFSSWFMLRRVVAVCLRFGKLLQARIRLRESGEAVQTSIETTVENLLESEMVLLRLAQRERFEEEIDTLQTLKACGLENTREAARRQNRTMKKTI